MSLWFLLPTATCVTAALLSSRWKDEPSLICAGLAILSFPVALILAPWEVQVLLLLSIVLVARYGIRSTESLEESVDGSLEESTASGMAGVLDRETADRPNFVGAWRSRLGWSDSHSSDSSHQARAATGTVAPPPTRSTDSVIMTADGDLSAVGDRIYRGVTWHQSNLNPDAPPSVPGTIKLKYRGATVERKL